MYNNQIFRNCFSIIYSHLAKVSAQINKCIISDSHEISITLSTLFHNHVIIGLNCKSQCICTKCLLYIPWLFYHIKEL